MRKNVLMVKNYELLVEVWLERMVALAEQLEDRAEHYPLGSQNHLELLAQAAGIRTSIEQLTLLENRLILNQNSLESNA